MHVGEGGVVFRSGDPLGLIFAIYHFSREFLGVSSLWFWEDNLPAPLQVLRVPLGVTRLSQPLFRFRGWFLNDEDLLCEFRPPSGQRALDYPFYGNVINLDLLDKVCEALLRCGGNLLIPASFVDVMNPAEAALVAHVAERGLYVSQHHIEPLGVSAFAFESWSRAQGEPKEYSFKKHPEELTAAWRAYAQRWQELAGERIVWQLGLRGKGDWAVWQTDPSIGENEAGDLISDAVLRQWSILQETTGRDAPLATFTLWNEGASLLAAGRLRLPAGVIKVHCDEGPSQEWTREFSHTPRLPGEAHGAYLHLAYWDCGPHLVEGVAPESIWRKYEDLATLGDTMYIIWNVANVREFTLGIRWAARLWLGMGGQKYQAMLDDEFPPGLSSAWRDLCAPQAPLPSGGRLQDGRCRQLVKELSASNDAGTVLPSAGCSRADLREILDTRISDFEARLRSLPPHTPTAPASVLLHLLKAVRALCSDSPRRLSEACGYLSQAAAERKAGLGPGWQDWYAGDRKFDLSGLLASLKEISPTTDEPSPPSPPRRVQDAIR